MIDPMIAKMIFDGVMAVGPIFFEMIAAAMRKESPLDVLASKRVADIVPDPLLSETVLWAKEIAAAIEAAGESPRGTHAEARRREADE